MRSRFEGGLIGLIGLIGVNILAWAVTFFTFGIATPWAMCIKYRWEAKHTVIEGRRLEFIGSGGKCMEKNVFLDKYLDRIGIKGELYPDLETLKKIQK